MVLPPSPVEDVIVPTPQQLHPGNRRVYGKRRRQRLIARQVAAHADAMVVHALAALPIPNAVDVLAAAETQLDLRYAISSCRCEPTPCWARDCSGLICFALNVRGYPHICTSSFGFAQLARDHGTIISKQQALWTPGAIGIRCPFCNPNSNGSNGHIWFCKGDGVHSIEEGGHATGCYEGLADKAGDVIFALIPGVSYAPPAPPKPKEEIDMVAVACPNKPALAPTAQPHALFLPVSDLFPHGAVACRHGANIKGSVNGLWTPAPQPGRKWVGMYEKVGRYDADPGPGVKYDPAKLASKGVVLVDDQGDTTTPDQGLWI